MIVGYLVPHKCPNRAVSQCKKCGRQFCDEHLSIEQGGLMCTACQQGLEQPIAVAATARTFTEDDLATFKTADLFDDDYDEGDTFSDLS
jgi:recombinational DNA repair protein (RecF pathway)